MKGPESDLQPLTLLIAEDSAVDRLLLSRIVGKQGHRVLLAANGAEAVTLFAEQRPQMVLMDALMPVMDGFEATEAIRAWELQNHRPHLPIIALTAGVLESERQHCSDAGMDAFLAKPVSVKTLAATVAAWVTDRNRDR